MLRRNLGLIVFFTACAWSAMGCGAASPYAVARASLSGAHKAHQAALVEWGYHYARKVAEIVDGGIAAKRPVEDIRHDLAVWRATADMVDAGFRATDAELRAAAAVIRVIESRQGTLDTSAIFVAVINAARGLLEVTAAAGFDARQWLDKIPGMKGVL